MVAGWEMIPEVHELQFLHMVVVLFGHGTVEHHVPGTEIPPQEGGCLLVHRPECKAPALVVVLACGELSVVGGYHVRAPLPLGLLLGSCLLIHDPLL